MIRFDLETQALLENGYAGADITRRRMVNLAALDPRQGDRVLDLGCGQGLLTVPVARAVGPEGFVTGVDPSPEMRATAGDATTDFPNIAIVAGDAESIPLEDGSQDRAVSLQVFEYVPDVLAGLRELHRVLRKDGRVVIGDMHWETLVLHSEEPDRMRAMVRAWDEHLADPALPARLPSLMRDAGFVDIRSEPLAFLDATLRPDGLATTMLALIEAFVRDRALVPDTDIAAWASEQRHLAATGRFFFSLTHVVTTARRA